MPGFYLNVIQLVFSYLDLPNHPTSKALRTNRNLCRRKIRTAIKWCRLRRKGLKTCKTKSKPNCAKCRACRTWPQNPCATGSQQECKRMLHCWGTIEIIQPAATTFENSIQIYGLKSATEGLGVKGGGVCLFVPVRKDIWSQSRNWWRGQRGCSLELFLL